ncbi:transmission trait enhancer LetE (plasmid) [Legionella adelaidensis]|uniref:Transmission trait enhancer LetE n=1 Tax=Legionella adelaidensis TaxID=45056 RepID=A0A0W0R5U5_9GAMM|nr:hypothetical protein [Legionella adelaidensis]KTC66454.1 transmission trait enhancer protein LetE [Legionella adelaidensis]VEH86258.1 transmission trait enhancer LetE [Legionella adelaidensis]
MKDIINVLPDIRLRFNIDHPTFEECYAFGYECAMAEVSENENPFKPGTSEYDQWAEGWWAGFYGEEPIYDIKEFLTANTSAVGRFEAANEEKYQDVKVGFFTKILGYSGELVALAVVGYQVVDLVA